RRSAHVVAPRYCCFPGGGIHPGESEKEALIREFREELAIEVRPVRQIWRSVTPWRVHLSWWSAELLGEASPVPNPAEVESIYWATPDEMANLPDSLPSNFEFLQAFHNGLIDLRIGDA
ncbi:MAG: NUDIX domain-containing protein, partial [Pirellulaceae bacterium]|nr:NUDIX domain-containing protein [Pirellulaceae bacterium]